MTCAKRIFCLLAVLCLTLTGVASAETKLFDPVAIVTYDRSSLMDWTPSYGLTMPGVLLELSHAEAILSVTAVDGEGLTPSRYLSAQLDRAGETLIVSNARLSQWEGASGTDESLLTYSYTYPEGDEIHLISSWAAVFGDMIVDVTVDSWGEDAAGLMEAAQAVFVEQGLNLTVYTNAMELTATLSDVIEDEAGQVCIQLTEAGQEFSRSDAYYPLAENAVLLFPNPDDPLLFNPVDPDFTSLVNAILAYEESSDSPAVFRTVLKDNQILFMEYGLMQ